MIVPFWQKVRLMSSSALVGSLAIPAVAYAIMRRCNETIDITETEIWSQRVPEAFDGFRIAHVSDLHDTSFGRENSRLIAKVAGLRPDLIAITGDLIHDEGIRGALAFVRGAVAIAPVVFIPGNHESYSLRYEQLRQLMTDAGVTILENDCKLIMPEVAPTTPKRGILGKITKKSRTSSAKSTLVMLGIADVSFSSWQDRRDPDTYIARALATTKEEAESQCLGDENPFVIVLSHRPEFLPAYAASGADLVLAGHAHGGQWRVPVLGGLYAPSQGVFPKYDAGVYRMGDTSMVVSRGLGNSGFPLRLNNHPELVSVTIRRGSSEQARNQAAQDEAAIRK